MLPFCMREVWVITACLALINATASPNYDGLVATDIEKEFYRLKGDLYSLCRVKVKNFLLAPFSKQQMVLHPLPFQYFYAI